MSGNLYLEQFCILANSSKGRALETIISQVLSHPSIFVFSELIMKPHTQEVS